MKHLILGSAGQVGHHLVKVLKEQNEAVITFDLIDTPDEDLRVYNNILLKEKIQNCDFVHFLAFDIGGSLYMKKYQDTYYWR
jgi:nucleoside-diphosphate-sugar epimerase